MKSPKSAESPKGKPLLGALFIVGMLIYIVGVFGAGYATGFAVTAGAGSGSPADLLSAGRGSARPTTASSGATSGSTGSTGSTATPAATPVDSPVPVQPVAAAPGTFTISMRTLGSSFGYVPASIAIRVGTTVRWVNTSSAPHTVTGFGVDSGIIAVGGQFSHTFSRTGTFTYKCLLHPTMTGIIVVSADTGGTLPTPPPPPPPPPPIIPPVAPPPPGVTAVTIIQTADFAFSPATITIPVGTTVRWTNATSAPHTVTTGAFDSGTMPAGGVYSHTFTQAGTFSYRCIFHPNMVGTVVVTGSAVPPSVTPPASTATQVDLVKHDGDYSFAPATLTIKMGTTVTWLNTTGDTLTVDGTNFHSPPMAREGGTWSYRFTVPGTYSYSSSLRPEMSGILVVTS